MQWLDLFTYHWMYIFSTPHTLATHGLHNAAVILVTYHWMYIFSTRHILATLGLHYAAVVLVYLPLHVYIFYSSYTCNTRTARSSGYTCLLTIRCIYFLLVIYLQHSDAQCSGHTCLLTIGCIYFLLVIYLQLSACTIQPLYSFTYHCMYIFSTHHILANIYLQHSNRMMQQLYLCTNGCTYLLLVTYSQHLGQWTAQCSYCTCVPVDARIWYSLYITTFRLHDATVSTVDLSMYILVLVIYCYFGLLDVAITLVDKWVSIFMYWKEFHLFTTGCRYSGNTRTAICSVFTDYHWCNFPQ